MGRKEMQGRAAPALIGALLVALVFGTIGIDSAAASAHGGGTHYLNAIEPYDQATETDTDLGDPGLSQGDLSTFHFEIYDPTGAVHLGYETSQCVVGSVGQTFWTFDCSSDFVLQSGQIETEGTLEFPVDSRARAFRSSGSGGLPYHFSVTGGTDTYVNARGQLDWGTGEAAVVLSFRLLG
jgi:hypothetical protein